MFKIPPEKYKSKIICEKDTLMKIIARLKKDGKKIGLCTGSFDLIHPGHITHLTSAKKFCDILIVAVAKDHHSSSKNPGSGRPIFSEDIRAFMVSELKPVNFVTFDECDIKDPTKDIVNIIKPDRYIKGRDYADLKNPGIIQHKKLVESYGGKLLFTDDEKLSTTEIIRYIQEQIK